MNTFIVIDFETAVYSPNSAISVGLVKFHNYQPVASCYSLIRPPNLYIRPDFTELHGLTVDDVTDAPDFEYLWEHTIREFIGTTVLAAHNAVFDMKVLRATLQHYDLPVPKLRYFCSLILSRRVWPAMRSHALTSLAREFNIVYEAHNALADAQTCGHIIALCAAAVSKKIGTEHPPALGTMLKKAGTGMTYL